MAQMTILTRQDIEGCLKRGMSVPQIATRVGKTPQAITAELKTRRIDSNKGLRRSNAICKWYRECKRTRVCDTNCGTQKPHVERNHEELMRILVKGTSLDGLDQDDVNVALSHINSYTRLSLGNSTPYDEFVKTYGYDGRRFLDRLGVVKIPANEVTLDPYVLGKRFKRHAERIILRKNGVKK